MSINNQPIPFPMGRDAHDFHALFQYMFYTWVQNCTHIESFFLVRLSLLTMTNPNQLCDVLLFVCSKMADETNLSSKLPVADRTREV